MALDTYANLITAIGDWLERSDTASLAPDWIALAEASMNRRLRVSRMIERASATISSGFGSLPSDFLAPYQFRLDEGDYRLLQYFSPLQMSEFKAAGNRTGTPQAYSVIAQEIEVGPVPSASVSTMLWYYQQIPALSGSNASNWVLASHPDAYLHGALLMAGVYYADEALQATHGALFNAAIDRIEAEDRTSAFAANPTLTPSTIAV